MALPALAALALGGLISGGVGSVLGRKSEKKQAQLMREQMAANERLAAMRLQQEKTQAEQRRAFESELAAANLLQQKKLSEQEMAQAEAIEQRRLETQKAQQRSTNIARQRELEQQRKSASVAASQAKEGRRSMLARGLARKNIKARPSRGFSGVSGAVLDEGIS